MATALLRGAHRMYNNRYILLSLTTFLLSNLLLLTHWESPAPSKHVNQVKFMGFMDDRVHWMYSRETVIVDVPVHLNSLTLSPRFDPPCEWRVRDLANRTDPSRFWNYYGSEFVVNVAEYIKSNVRLQKFLIDIDGHSQLPLTMNIHLLEDLNLDDWEGINDEEMILGDGGYGVVYQVRHKRTGQVAALKVREMREYRTKRSSREFEVLKKLRGSKYVSQIHGFAVSDKRISEHVPHAEKSRNPQAMMLMELLGGDVFHLLKGLRKEFKVKKRISHISREEAEREAELHRQIAKNSTRALVKGLIELRSINMAHLDLKTTNVLWELVGERQYQFKLTDFGTSQPVFNLTTGEYITHHSRVGTRGYWDPMKMYDARVDNYAVGVYAFTLVARRNVWRGPNDRHGEELSHDAFVHRAHEIGNVERCKFCFRGLDIPDELKDFTIQMMKYRPEHRMSLEDALQHPYLAEIT